MCLRLDHCRFGSSHYFIGEGDSYEILLAINKSPPCDVTVALSYIYKDKTLYSEFCKCDPHSSSS